MFSPLTVLCVSLVSHLLSLYQFYYSSPLIDAIEQCTVVHKFVGSVLW